MLLLQPHHRKLASNCVHETRKTLIGGGSSPLLVALSALSITIFIITMLLVLAFLPVDGKPNNGDYEHNRANNNNLPSSAGDEIQAMAQQQQQQLQDTTGDTSSPVGNPNHVRPHHETLIRGYPHQHMHLRGPSSSITKIDPLQSHLQPKPQPHEIPAFFVFGDSLVDSGNNNFLFSFARADYLPYGIDFPLGTTGRFCNGRTVADFIAEGLGLPFIPPYLSPLTHINMSPHGISKGVNYASGAAGILDSSGGSFMARLPFDRQIHNFHQSLQELECSVRSAGKIFFADYLAKSLFGIVFGSNDYLDNYLLHEGNLSSEHTNNIHSPQDFKALVAQTFHNQLADLYGLGARRFLIAGVGPLGCIPKVLSKSKDGQCAGQINGLIESFNLEVLHLVDALNRDPGFQGATFLYAKIYEKVYDILDKPGEYGFRESKSGCCGLGKYKGMLTCLPIISPLELCDNRETHVFWDAYHPTQAVNRILADAIFHGDASEIVPMNLNRLISLS